MTAARLYRLSGLAALLGGLGRMASALTLPLNQIALETLWTGIDVLLTLGLIGIYLARAPRLGLLGLTAFVLAIASLSFIGGPDADVFGFSTYEQGAAALAISMVGLALAWVRANERPLLAPFAWFASVIAIGAFSALPAPLPSFGFPAAGVLFGVGFAAAGWDLLRRQG